ncbi:MAG: hypothetical protein DMG30_02310 [Acidobacteria bacterium]|nr:MAG: hypothetical protein DMG30_02310 [Acidobacteriota bacterium]
MFQKAGCQFSVLTVETRFLDLLRNGLQMPVGPRHEVRTAHLAFIERGDSGFETPFGGAVHRHLVSSVEIEIDAKTARVSIILQQRGPAQNSTKVCFLE